ncbi:hypothetical protein CAEBREN_14507 [Caenorhabditis brenneri]|uniref:Ubiquitin-like domain-containing protein n=1 Tax=Caenorhabditis brenneri TaxID=135651 RepID=G0MMV9_CAEBE|nr:hypothetical protein CAEBREN_14507 [Caenorhabditis brenneri]
MLLISSASHKPAGSYLLIRLFGHNSPSNSFHGRPGTQFEDGMTLADYDVADGSIVYFVFT